MSLLGVSAEAEAELSYTSQTRGWIPIPASERDIQAGDAGDTTKVAAAFGRTLPVKSVQGDLMTLGGKATSGVDQQIMSTMYIGVIKDGKPVVVGKAK